MPSVRWSGRSCWAWHLAAGSCPRRGRAIRPSEIKALQRYADTLTYTRRLRGNDTASLFEVFLQEARAHLDHVTQIEPG
jgi:hypothetical protein